MNLDITDVVRDWVENPDSNYGIVLKGSGSVSVEYCFASMNWPDERVRPRLVVSAGELPVSTPTPSYTPSLSPTATQTPWPTATWTPYTPSPTPTRTMTPLPTATATVGPSPTWTLTLTPSYTPTPTATPTEGPTATPTATVYVAATPTALLGSSRYELTADVTLNEWAATQNLGSSPVCWVRQGGVHQTLLKMDLTELGSGLTVDRAMLHLYVDQRSNTGTLSTSVYRVLRPWIEGEATWQRASAAQAWSASGCSGTGDRETTPLATFTLDAERHWYSIDITQAVQGWLDDPGSNHGLLIYGTGGVSVQYGIAARDHGVTFERPWLEVRAWQQSPTPTATPIPTATWTPQPTATPTATATATVGPSPTATPTIVPQPTRLSGSELIAVTDDTFIDLWYIDNNYGDEPHLIVRQGDVRSSLLYAPMGSGGTGQTVLEARLHLYVLGRTNAGYLFTSVHQVLTAWDGDVANWNLAAEGIEWGQAGANQVGNDRAGESLDQVTFKQTGQWVSYDITEAVRDWYDDPSSNHGLIIKGGGSVSVEYLLASSDFEAAEAQPWIEVVLGEASPTPTMSLTPTASPQPSDTPTVTPTFTDTATPTMTATTTHTPTPTCTATLTHTPTPTATPSHTPTPTCTVTMTPSPTPTGTTTLQPTATITLTSTPSPSPTHTATLTLTSTPTQTTAPTMTNTPTQTTTPTQTVTPSPSPSPSPTIPARPTPWEGAISYDAGTDTSISAWYPSDTSAGETTLRVRQDDIEAALIQFELSDLNFDDQGAPRQPVVRAELLLYVSGRSNDNELVVRAYELYADWIAGQANWLQASDTYDWAEPGANGLDSDRDQVACGEVTCDSIGRWIRLDVTRAVQDWQTRPGSNAGLVIKGSTVGPAVGYMFGSLNHPNPEARPRLYIEYEPQSANQTFHIGLRSGLNMISLPLQPITSEINAALAPLGDALVRVWAYDSDDVDDPWKMYEPGYPANDLHELDVERGVLVRDERAGRVDDHGHAAGRDGRFRCARAGISSAIRC